ncbi:MAG: STAS/SEC14 domain-containing protein [Bacteroidia bacterium]|nr:STAS/SEC14 domain-containing protein [Bacteroidia bacterium]
MLTIPKNTKIKDWGTSTTWFDEDGILCSISKKGAPHTLEDTKKRFDEFKKVIGNKKICMLVDVTNTNESTREIRNYAAEELPKIVKAIAMVSTSAVGKMLANLFFTLKTQPYPTKMFNNEKDAKKWLQQFL